MPRARVNRKRPDPYGKANVAIIPLQITGVIAGAMFCAHTDTFTWYVTGVLCGAPPDLQIPIAKGESESFAEAQQAIYLALVERDLLKLAGSVGGDHAL